MTPSYEGLIPLQNPDAGGGVESPASLGVGEAVAIDTEIYDLDAVFRAAYALSGRAHVYLGRPKDGPVTRVVAMLWPRRPADPRRDLVGAFLDRLVDERLRGALEREMAPVRELIVAQAFAEGNLLDPDREELDYEADPLGITAGA